MASKRDRRTVRFGIGEWDGPRSSTWRVWNDGADSSVYLASRDIGGSVKVSLHPRDAQWPGREWRVALTRESTAVVDPKLRERMSGRVMRAWDSESGRLGNSPLRQGYAVVLGRFSVGVYPRPASPDEHDRRRRKLAKVLWVKLPPVDWAWQFTTLIGDAGTKTEPPGVRAMGATPVGHFALPHDDGDVWVMRHLIPLTESMRQLVTSSAQQAASRFGSTAEHSVYRGVASTKSKDNALRAYVEVAVTVGAPADALDI